MKKLAILTVSFLLITIASAIYAYHAFSGGTPRPPGELASICSIIGILYGSIFGMTLVMCVPSHATPGK